MKMKCFTAEDILLVEHKMIRDLCIFDWVEEDEKLIAKVAMYINGVNDVAAELLKMLEAENEQ